MLNAPLTVVYRPIDTLIGYARNARTHSDEQVDQIAASIREFGWTNPILIDEQLTIIAGHGRLAAAKKLGMDEVPTITLAGLTEAQRRALILADNRLALNAGWDEDLLKIELLDLADAQFDISLLGFDDKELAAIMAPAPSEGLTDPDETPEVPQEPASELGDVWILGRHRLVCGDSTDTGTVEKALAGVVPMLMVTDPPYGVEYDAGWRGEAKNGDGKPLSTGKGRAKGKVENDNRGDWSAAWALFPGDVAYVWHGERQLVSIADQLQDSGFELRNLIVWGKSGLVVGRGNYHSQHETCWYVVRKGGTGHWSGDRKQTTLWQIDKPQKSETGHSTQKPVECMARPIRNNSSPGQAVYEPFSGSGTTIIACEQEGRSCHAIELNPAYVDVAVTRWEKFAGKQAILEETGETYLQVLARRRPNAQIKAEKK
ncbi:conserved hypothetical protein [uncultured Pleomorphomonas sp.]|uniref:Methyltransferase n=1 Tax=uncultured Pleomorphomonas sp. TaxID=442121 RepID=A0A212L1Z5_9HYPH|nr:DNA methyltransferase [uncultured Pleomorphomonas sp.]SCM71573.1 conserved hypothetical protein [uncultured Pleomorphomonas sp.]